MLLFILPFITFVRNVVEVRSTSILFPSFNIKASKYENHAIYRNRLRAVFGGKPVGYVGAGFREKYKVYMVSNSHLDTQWRWDVKATIDDYLYNTAVQNLALLEKYPHYVFNFEGAVKYEWIKEYYPHLFERIRKFVADGRWNISGASVRGQRPEHAVVGVVYPQHPACTGVL